MERLNWLHEHGDFNSLLTFILDLETYINRTRKGVIQ